jgi:hypothetical protein
MRAMVHARMAAQIRAILPTWAGGEMLLRCTPTCHIIPHSCQASALWLGDTPPDIPIQPAAV